MTFGSATQTIFHALFFPLPANWKEEDPVEDSEALKMTKPYNGKAWIPECGHVPHTLTIWTMTRLKIHFY